MIRSLPHKQEVSTIMATLMDSPVFRCS